MSVKTDRQSVEKVAEQYADRRFSVYNMCTSEMLLALLKRAEDAEHYGELARNEIETLRSKFADAEKARQAYKVDAERYRWLRQGDNDDHVIRHLSNDRGTVWLLRREALDTAIDAALSAERVKVGRLRGKNGEDAVSR